MKQTLVLTEPLSALLRHLPPGLKKKIRSALDEIVQNPSAGKALVEELDGLYSYRVGKIRIIYRTEGSAVVLVAVGPRKAVYHQIALELKRSK